MIDNFGNSVFFINKLPVNAVTSSNPDGSYTIFIKAQLSDSQKMRSYLHELRHIQNDDFYRSDVQDIEHEAHSEISYVD